ncbi:SDR family oxidoreductase [uncultured Nocardioides sp.]|uniref:SDR family NAD(P)-dependent oxidoreductase n=1 Tax=uncultured Nocardioides sp. TaxID=198441 RepID=UPI002633BECC|nr:SDR family oxidoreductase [uncultured Nocardioides sp.]
MGSRTAAVPTSGATGEVAGGGGTALVTGASAGLGWSFARLLAERGHDLVLVARDAPRLEAVAARLRSAYGVEVEVLPADLSDPVELATVERRLAEPERPVALLVNNAGAGLRGRFLDHDVEQEQAMLDLLVTAPMRLTHAALTQMTERGHGSVLNVASVAAFLPRGTYGAAKAWLVRFSTWAAAEYADRGVRVAVTCPGFVRTEFHTRMGVAPGRGPLWLDADRVAARALDDLARGRALSVPTRRYRVITAAARTVPDRALQRLQTLGR